MDREQEIRLIAYRIWEEDECCHGHDIEHWLKAEAVWQEQQLDQPKQLQAVEHPQPGLKANKPVKPLKAPRRKS